MFKTTQIYCKRIWHLINYLFTTKNTLSICLNHCRLSVSFVFFFISLVVKLQEQYYLGVLERLLFNLDRALMNEQSHSSKLSFLVKRNCDYSSYFRGGIMY